MTTTEDHVLKDEHLQLAGVIKGVHRQLRRQFRESGGDYSSVWQDHLKNRDALLSYAQAMKNLAQQHWAVYPETRIDWCYKVIVEYFLCDGLKKALEKDAKRRYFEQKRQMQLQCAENGVAGQSSVKRDDHQSVYIPVSVDEKSREPADQEHSPAATDTTVVTSLYESEETKCLSHPPSDLSRLAHTEQKIRLLDVGSCYNAFQAFDKLHSVGIDLCPADESVYQCDFLDLQITPGKDDQESPPLTSPVTQMPARCFHVVVFSLLLEYLPSPDQRYQCCVKAHSLLHMHGLLLLVTPDSHSQHRNAPMMKSWKKAMESLGFSRWKYEKKDHIHCMAFRKVSECTQDFNATEGRKELAQLLYIPQDFNDACYDDADRYHKQTKDGDDDGDAISSEDFVAAVEKELPFFLFSDGNGSSSGSDDDEDEINENDKEDGTILTATDDVVELD